MIRIAPMLCLVTFIAAGATNGCAALPWAKTVNDLAQDACESALSTRSEVAEAAKIRGYSVSQWTEALCKVSDIVDIFLATRPSEQANKAVQQTKSDLAVKVGKEKGLL